MLGALTKLFGGGEAVATPIEAIGNVFDKLFTSDEERAAAAAVMEKLKQHPGELQVQLNMLEAQHKSWFVAGWRPFIGWVCGTALAMYYLPQYTLAAIIWARLSWDAGTLVPYPIENVDGLMELVIAMLGLGAMRTIEKFGNKTK